MGKFCGNCGATMSADASFCTKCGKAIKGETKKEVVTEVTSEPSPTNGFAIAGFVCSFFFNILGLVFSIIGINKSKDLNGNGKGLAIAGIIISSAGFILDLIAIIFYISVILTAIGANF